MLSICIPVYNCNISNLITQLLDQVERLNIPWEILLIDDGSDQEVQIENERLLQGLQIRYLVLEKNIGRVAIRNLLCKEASYENLLFLDNDSILISDNFLKDYLCYLNVGAVIYGGTRYQNEKPGKSFRLHWKYGLKREVTSLKMRNQSPYLYFRTNNFMIPAHILKAYPLNEQMCEYGHEDTLLAWVLSQNNIPLFHFDNPVLHLGLEEAESFLNKTEAAVRNLERLKQSGYDEMLKTLKLFRVFKRIERTRMVGLGSCCWKYTWPFQRWIIRRWLCLGILDFYKLGYLCFLHKKSND